MNGWWISPPEQVCSMLWPIDRGDTTFKSEFSGNFEFHRPWQPSILSKLLQIGSSAFLIISPVEKMEGDGSQGKKSKKTFLTKIIESRLSIL